MDASPKITVSPRSSPLSFSQPCYADLLYSSSLSLSVVQVASRVLVTAAADASVCLTLCLLCHPLPLLPPSANGCYTAVTIIYFVTACLCKEFPSHHRLLVVGVRKHIGSKSNFPIGRTFPFWHGGSEKPFSPDTPFSLAPNGHLIPPESLELHVSCFPSFLPIRDLHLHAFHNLAIFHRLPQLAPPQSADYETLLQTSRCP